MTPLVDGGAPRRVGEVPDRDDRDVDRVPVRPASPERYGNERSTADGRDSPGPLSGESGAASAPTAELPVEDLDVEPVIESRLPEEGVDRGSCWRLERQNDADRPCLFGREQLAVDDQALAR